MTERKDLIQEILPLEAEGLLGAAQDLKTGGYRLGQACATMAGSNVEVLYSFEKDNVLRNLKITIGAKTPVLQSVTAIYPYAFIYENEMHDLFGITFKNLQLDYGGKFFKIAKQTPWNPEFAGAPEDGGAPGQPEDGEPPEDQSAGAPEGGGSVAASVAAPEGGGSVAAPEDGGSVAASETPKASQPEGIQLTKSPKNIGAEDSSAPAKLPEDIGTAQKDSGEGGGN